MDNKLLSVMQGQAGVHRVASELMLRGLHVCFPAADVHGVDLTLESGIKIQVKAVRLGVYERTPYGAYWFNFGRSKYDPDLKKIVKIKRNYSTQCDFVVLWGIDDNKFWIVPAKVFDGANGVVMGRKSQYNDFSVDDVKRLQNDGHTQYDVAKMLGVNQATVSRRLGGKFTKPKRVLADEVRKHEDAWHLIHELEISRQPRGELVAMPALKEAVGA